MRAVVTASELARTLNRLNSVIVAHPPMVAYTGVHIAVRDTRVTVTASDATTTVKLDVDCHGPGTPGSVLLPPGPLHKWLGTLDDDAHVTLSSDNSSELHVESENHTYTFRTLATTFPESAASTGTRTSVNFDWLARACAAVATSAAALTSERGDDIVQLVTGSHGIRLHTTDKFRVTRVQVPGVTWPHDINLLLPLKVLKLLVKLEVDAVVDTGSHATCGFGVRNGTVITRVADIAFPAVDAVVDTDTSFSGTVDVASAKEALARLACVASASRPLVATIESDCLVLNMDSVDIGSGEESVAFSTDADRMTFGVNLTYLQDAFAAVDGSGDATLGWVGPSNAFHVSTSGPQVDVHVVLMPVNLNS